MQQPIKRHEAIKPMSREHHHGLLVGWKIRMGLRNEISPARIRKYLNWFYTHHLLPHFMLEEQHLFPVLGPDHEEVQEALSHHYEVHRFFMTEDVSVEDLIAFEQVMTKHIRFEERILFNTIQARADERTLQLLEEHLMDHIFEDNETDPFWIS